MIMNKIFKHVEHPIWEELESETTDEGRYYQTPDGERYPSVTTVTGHDKKRFFAEWRRKNPEESKRVLKRGNKLHNLIERYLSNEDGCVENTDSSTSSLFYQIVEDLGRIDNIVGLEKPLWSHALKLAGRIDCIAEFDGKLSIIDFKGSTKFKRESDIQNYFMQAAAYAIMFQERTKTPIQQIVILISCETGDCQVFVDNPIKYVKKLHKCIKKYHKSIEDSTSNTSTGG
jgi:genome maintenance exonuclease 1